MPTLSHRFSQMFVTEMVDLFPVGSPQVNGVPLKGTDGTNFSPSFSVWVVKQTNYLHVPVHLLCTSSQCGVAVYLARVSGVFSNNENNTRSGVVSPDQRVKITDHVMDIFYIPYLLKNKKGQLRPCLPYPTRMPLGPDLLYDLIYRLFNIQRCMLCLH